MSWRWARARRLEKEFWARQNASGLARDVLEGRDFAEAGRHLRPHDARSADPGQVFAVLEAAGDLDGLELARAVDQDVGARIEQKAAPDFVLPVIVMGEAAQRGLDPAEDDGDAGEKMPDLVGIDEDGPVGHAGPVGCVLVLGPRPLERACN